MVRIRCQIQGLEEAFEKLQQLGAKIAKQTARRMANAGGKILKDAVKARAKQLEVTGQYWRSIGLKVKVYRNSGVAVALVGTRPGFRIAVGVRKRGKNTGDVVYHDPQKIDHLLEYGTDRAPAFAPLRKSLDEQGPAIKEAMTAEVKKAVGDAW